MSDIRTSMTPTKRMAKLLAEMHYYYAKELIARLGPEEGKKAVSAALKNMADSRIAAMKQDAIEQGLTPSGKAVYKKIKDFPTPDWDRDENGKVSYCPMAETWATYEDGVEIGGLYCAIDFDLYAGFDMELKRPECLGEGGSCCDFQPKEL